jgi:hypothetical protein
MTFGATYNFTIWEYIISRLIGGNAIPRLFLTFFPFIALPSIRRGIFFVEEI